MVLQKKLKKQGNSYALIIEKPILQLLHYDLNTVFSVTTDGKKLILEPIDTQLEKVKDAADLLMDKYSDVFEKLAK